MSSFGARTASLEFGLNALLCCRLLARMAELESSSSDDQDQELFTNPNRSAKEGKDEALGQRVVFISFGFKFGPPVDTIKNFNLRKYAVGSPKYWEKGDISQVISDNK